MADLVDKPVKLEQRTVLRKKLTALRHEGFVPGVIHNHGADSVHIMGSGLELEKIYKAAGKHHPLELRVGEEKYLALIKDAHFNPVKKRLEHLVFQAIKRNEKVEAEVPIHLEGDAPAEKVGLMVLRQLDSVEVEALPRNLPDELKVSAEKLAELHDAITVADLEIPEGVKVLTALDHPIARVVETPDLKAEAAEEEVAEGEAEEGTEEAEASKDSSEEE